MTSEERALAFQKRHYLTGITDSLVLMFDQHAEEQRQRCGNNVRGVARVFQLGVAVEEVFENACLDATGEEQCLK